MMRGVREGVLTPLRRWNLPDAPPLTPLLFHDGDEILGALLDRAPHAFAEQTRKTTQSPPDNPLRQFSHPIGPFMNNRGSVAVAPKRLGQGKSNPMLKRNRWWLILV